MRLIDKFYYRQHGIRSSDRMINLPNFTLAAFPRGAMFHVVSVDPAFPEIDASQPYYQGYPKKIVYDYVTDYVKTEGPVRKPMFNLNDLTRNWKRKHREHWQYEPENALTLSNPDTLVVRNYGYLEVLHKYVEVQLTPYYKWLNRTRTVWAHVAEAAQRTDRQQFVVIKLPSLLQGKTFLDRYSKEALTIRLMSLLAKEGGAGLNQLDLWMWLSITYREKSLMSVIKPEHYGRINLVFESAQGHQALVKLAYLNSWIKGQENQTEFGNVVQFEPMAIQKLFLKLCMNVSGALLEENALADVAIQTKTPTQNVPVPKTSEEPSQEEITEGNEDEVALAKDQEGIVIDTEDPDTEAHLLPVTQAVIAKPKLNPSTPLQTADQIEARIDHPELIKAMMDDLEKDIEALDRISLVQLKNAGVKLNKERVEAKVVAQATPAAQDASSTEEESTELPPVDLAAVKLKLLPISPAERLKQRLVEEAEANLVTAADYRKLEQTLAQYQASADPYGSAQKRVDAMKIHTTDLLMPKELTTLPVGDEVPDKTMASSSLLEYDRHYLKHVYKKDVLQAIDAVQAAGVTIRRHEIDVSHSVLGTYEHHTLELKPIDGAPSTISFTLPQVDEEGYLMAGGNKYLLRRQRVDVPIRKIAPQIVALSTYYGKTFVQTSPKVSNSSLAWLYRQINLASLEKGHHIHDVNPGDVFDNDLKAPYIYGALSHQYEQLKAGELELYFNHHVRQTKVNPELLKMIEVNGRVWCGWTPEKHPVVVASDNHFYRVYKNQEEDLGTIYQVLQLEEQSSPLDFSEVRIFSKYVPVGVVLGYYLGLRALIALLNAPYRTVPNRKSKNLQPDEYALVFKDQSLVFKRDNRTAELILAGFTDFEKVIRVYDVAEFDNPDVYLNLLLAKKMGAIYIRELDMLKDAFVDPISKEILEDMGEPVTFLALLIRATELLQTYHHPASQDRSVMRDRGYERFAGTVYKEVMQAVRQFRNKNLVGRSKIDMSPYQVWNAVMGDSALKIIEDTNPIQNLKEQEVITYSGNGGRDQGSMTKASRAYHKSDVGILSESTVDSSAVGAIAYLSANPNLKNVRGLAKEDRELSPTNLLSTSAIISPVSTLDPVKRITFIATQHSHTIASPAYRQPYVRTGYEFVIGKRTGKMFAYGAKEDGQVTAITEKGLIATYASGEQLGIELGRVYGKAEGTIYPHDIVAPYQVGAKFKRGDILVYNSKFFEPDFLEPTKIVLKINGAITTAFMESNRTHEDSSSIGPHVGEMFKTEVTKVKSYTVNFTQNLLEVKKVSEVVSPKDILMIIEDEITASYGQFSDDALSTLKRLQNVAPRAGVKGTIERIEVFYHGDKRDMSPTLKKLADRSDTFMAETAKSTNRPIVNGKVTEEYRVNGTPLELDKAEVRFYVTSQAKTGVGDKAVFGHQMKSTIAEVHRGSIHTEEGSVVDATFSYTSVAARGVLSPAILGTTITLLDAIGQRAVKIYNGEAK